MPILNVAKREIDLTIFSGQVPDDFLGLPVTLCLCGKMGLVINRGVIHKAQVVEDEETGVWHVGIAWAKPCERNLAREILSNFDC